LSLKNLSHSSPERLGSPLLNAIIESIKDKKGEDVVSLVLTGIQEAVTDCFVICSADSKVQVKAISDFIEEKVMQKTGERPYHVEGRENMEWVLIDYVDVVAHVFLKPTREHFALEEVWSDALVTEHD
jgi:ribosome-associated protein